MADIIQQRRDTAARWAQYNPILMEGEVGYVTDNPNQYKIGNGRDRWNNLPLRGYTGTITQDTGDDENAVMSQKATTEKLSELGSKAINFEIGELLDGFINGGNGEIVTASTYNCSDYIRITEGIDISFNAYFSDAAGLAFYDLEKKFIEGYKRPSDVSYGEEVSIKTPQNSSYVRISCRLDDVSMLKVSLVNSIPTAITALDIKLSEKIKMTNNALTAEKGVYLSNNTSELIYEELPIKINIGDNYSIKLIEGTEVTIYTKETPTGNYTQQGTLTRENNRISLNTLVPINYIAVYSSKVEDKKVILSPTDSLQLKVSNNEEKIENLETTFNYAKEKVNDISEQLIFEQGYIVYTSGRLVVVSNYKSTPYIQIKETSKIEFPAYFSDAAGVAFYDKDKRFISGRPRTVELGEIMSVEVPTNAWFVRTCFKDNNPFYLRRITKDIVYNANGLRRELFEFDLGDLLSEYITYGNGKAVSASTYIATDYIRVPQGKIEIPIYFSDAAGMAFYNENKEYISGFGKTIESYGDTAVIDIPINAQYIRLSWLASYKDKVYALYIGNLLNVISKVDANQKDTINPCLYTETSGCRTFERILCIGDSLTQGTFEYTNEQGEYVYYNDDRYSYPTFLKNISGRDVTNAGTGGLTTKSWWEMHQNDDFSGHDACIIALGRNDYVSGRETTSEERYTYMANIINAVRAANPKIKVFVATMLNYYAGTGADAVNNDMRSIAEANNCFLVDISKYGKLVQKDYSYSHLTATGYEKVANYYFNYISYIMANQPNEFKNVQFVGTDYSFDA